jgi:hypothetical protein
MCPACIASAAWAVAGATSTGGLAALIAIKLRGKTGAMKTLKHSKPKEKSS